ncbi:major facilitator superfamily domain-containing protein [Aspergillus foveolatus]|uniref:major facilitator superfamily domain-containing protein n=1 Tax=Aspergillus foveolatus TaxID=210207 RepID=UPI003CCDF868
MAEGITYIDLTFDSELPPPARPKENVPPPNLDKLGSPYHWSPFQKSFITWLSCLTTLFASFATSCFSPGTEQISSEWGVSRVAAFLGITTFCCGMGFAPMLLVPLSEIVGRRPVFLGTGAILVIFQLCCAVTRLYSGMLIARLFTGAAGSTFTTMVGGIVADMYVPRERNAPMAVFTGTALFGTGLGPLVCGFIAQYTTWRWIFYMQTIIDGILALALLFFFRETRGVVILRKRAKALNMYYERLEKAGSPGMRLPQSEKANDGQTHDQTRKESNLRRIRWRVAKHEARASIATTLRVSVSRSFLLLCTEPVVFFFSLWAAFSWSVMYINLAAIPLVYQSTYGFSLSSANAIFTATCAASIISTLLSITQSILASRHERWNTVPEHRLYFACVESVLLPAGLFMFGWTSQHGGTIPWIVPTIAVGISTMGIFSIYLSVFNYLADTYVRYASSALAAQNFCRNLMNGVFPLVSRQLFENLGYGPAASLLGGIAAGLCLVPWLLVVFGKSIRRRSRLASESFNRLDSNFV